MGLIVGVAALAGFLGMIAQKARRMAKTEVCRSDECCGDVDANTCHWAWKFVKALSKRAQRLLGESFSVKQGRVDRVRNLEGMASSAGNAGFPGTVGTDAGCGRHGVIGGACSCAGDGRTESLRSQYDFIGRRRMYAGG